MPSVARAPTAQPDTRPGAQNASASIATPTPWVVPGPDTLGSDYQHQPADREVPAFGATPQPTPEIHDKFNQWVRQVVDPENTLDLVVGRPRILILKQVPQKVQIPDEKVAAYDVLSDKELSVIGVAVGTTVLNLWFEDPTAPSGRTLLSYFVRVVPDPEARVRLDRVYQALEQEINKAFPDSRVILSTVGTNLIVSGQAKDASDAEKIIRIIEANTVAGSSGGTANPASSTTAPSGEATAPPSASDVLALARNGIAGTRRTQNSSRPQGGGASRGSNIINLLRVPGESQIMLRVTVAEVNRSAARSIGMSFSYTNNKGSTVFSNLTSGLALGGGNLPMLLDNGQLNVALEALRTLNLAKSLAEPNLVTVNGQTASFQAGGKFPVPVVTGATATGLEGVQFIPFGVSLDFTPYMTEKDVIRLVFSAEVSTRDASSGTSVGGSSVSGLASRNVQTTVDLKPGQTLAVAGLIQQNYGSSNNHIPFFGDMPLLSSLLGTNSTSAAEQELVILINAELVHPMDSRDIPPLPGSDILEPNDTEFFLGGRLESRNGPDFRSPTRTDFERMTRYQRLGHAYLFGPSGHSDGRTGEELPSKQKLAKLTTQS